MSEAPARKAEQPDTPDAVQRGGDSSGGRWHPSETVIRAGQVAAGISAMLTLGVFVWAHFIDNGTKPVPPPHARITPVSTYPDVTLRSYLSGGRGTLERWISHAKKAGFTDSDINATLGTKGVEAQFAVTLEGPPGMKVSVARNLFNAHTLSRVPEEGVSVAPPARFVRRSEPAQFTESTWVAAPRAPGRYFVELELQLPSGQALETAKSRAVTLTP
jgi:hypothetical protein